MRRVVAILLCLLIAALPAVPAAAATCCADETTSVEAQTASDCCSERHVAPICEDVVPSEQQDDDHCPDPLRCACGVTNAIPAMMPSTGITRTDSAMVTATPNRLHLTPAHLDRLKRPPRTTIAS